MIVLLFKMILRYISSSMVKYIPRTQRMCERAVKNEPRSLKFVPDHFKTQEMCERAVEKDSWLLRHVPDELKTQEMCEKAVEKEPWRLMSLITLRPKRYVKGSLKMNHTA